MLIKKFKLSNYKNFLETPELDFGTGFTVLTGRNNAGKTAYLETLTLRLPAKPHRSLRSAPRPTDSLNPSSHADVTIELSGAEFAYLLRHQITIFSMPVSQEIYRDPDRDAIIRRILASTEQAENIEIRFRAADGNRLMNFVFPPITDARHERSFGNVWATLRRDPGQESWTYEYGNPSSNDLTHHIAAIMRDRIYKFDAERLNVGTSTFGDHRDLASNASNLPEVLNVLQDNAVAFRRYNELVRRVLPQVGRVSVRPTGHNQLRIMVWDSPDADREDLAIPLTESGTGIGQVLAMIYVVETAPYARTIIIDEPNSFLHPGAVTALIEVLRGYPQHQFIISTHSSSLISAATPERIYMIHKEGLETTIKSMRFDQVQELRVILHEIGATLSGVFGADSILWVEGKTEQHCFPIIRQKLSKMPLNGVAIVGVVNTGDFEGKLVKTVADIYAQLSRGAGLLPPAIGFIFDREKRSEAECEAIKANVQGRVEFIRRRTYENYLLNPKAVAAVMNTLTTFHKKPVAVETVEQWFEVEGQKREYGCPIVPSSSREQWLAKVDAPKLLQSLFRQLSEAKEEYAKVKHGAALTEWLIDHSPGDLAEIAALLDQLIPAARTSS